MEAAQALVRVAARSPAWEGLRANLAHARLPTDDLLDDGQEFYALAGEGEPAAFGGFILHGRDALMRSIVVPAAQRGRGHGRSVVLALLGRLRDLRVAKVWLLTETPAFFEHLGFAQAPRDAAPAEIAATREFSTLCPASAKLMAIDLWTNTPPVNVLFLCTHNSARSILAEALLNHLGRGRIRAFSAGSSPRENQQPNPLALRVLRDAGVPTQDLRSKSWDEFAGPEAPAMDLVITVCDNAAGETCPYWPGAPATAHWRYPDPSEFPGTQEEKLGAFAQTLRGIRHRLELFLAARPEALDRASLQAKAREMANVF